MRFAHVINPVSVNKNNSSYLYYTQPITFESMYQSKMLIEKKIKMYMLIYIQLIMRKMTKLFLTILLNYPI